MSIVFLKFSGYKEVLQWCSRTENSATKSSQCVEKEQKIPGQLYPVKRQKDEYYALPFQETPLFRCFCYDFFESAQLHAPCAKNVLACQRALHAYVLTYQRVLCAYLLMCKRVFCA